MGKKKKGKGSAAARNQADAYDARVRAYGDRARTIMASLKVSPDLFMGNHIMDMVMRDLESGGKTVDEICASVESSAFYNKYFERHELLAEKAKKRAANNPAKPDPWKQAKESGMNRPTYAEVMNLTLVRELKPLKPTSVKRQVRQPGEPQKKSKFSDPVRFGIPNLPVNGSISKKPVLAVAPAKVLNPAQHVKDPVIVNGVEYRSTREAMATLAIGENKHAREFRLAVKAKGADYWTHNGDVYRFELKNKRPDQVAALEQEERELVDRELSASGRVAEVFQRDPKAQGIFRDNVCDNFDFRCAVTGKRLGGVLEAAHIEGAAVAGCYNASNGVLLAPTFHKLYDRHLMGINPDTMTVHFAEGIEWEEYEGKTLPKTKYRLDKTRLAARWTLFKGNKR